MKAATAIARLTSPTAMAKHTCAPASALIELTPAK